jgi:hypothetical protein
MEGIMSDRPRGRAHGGQGGAEPRRRIRLRELQVLEQHLAGRSQHQIATALQISQPAVSKILRRIEDRLLADVAYKFERQRARQTLQLEFILREALQAWRASQQDHQRRRQRRSDGGTGEAMSMAELVSENRHGDPRYLDEARKAMGDLRTLWGLAEPERLAVTAHSAMTDAALEAEIVRQARLLDPERDRGGEIADDVLDPDRVGGDARGGADGH